MELHEALDRLDAIHNHLTRSEEYRGFWTAGVALTGVIGLAAAALQAAIAPGAEHFVAYWVGIAAVCGVFSGGPVLYSYFAVEDDFARRRTRRVLGQFLPCLLVGAALTWLLPRVSPEVTPCLPGVWAMVFGLGLMSARPYLPPAVVWLAGFYLAAGALLLAWGSTQSEPAGWAVGGVFGPGHLASAIVLARGYREECDG